MKTSRSVLALLCAFAFVGTATATTVIPPSFDELVSHAQLIFEGTVTDVQSQWVGEGGQRHIVSYVTFKVDDSIKGEPGGTYTLRMLGGTVGDRTMRVTDAPEFKIGDREILFVENNGSQFVPLVGIMHGRFRVQKDAARGADVVLTNSGKAVTDVSRLGKEDDAAHAHTDIADVDAVPAATTLDAASFKSAIRAKLDNAQR